MRKEDSVRLISRIGPVVRSAPATGRAGSRDRRASGPAKHRQLVVRLRQRRSVGLMLQIVTGILLALCLRSFRRRSLEQPASPESRRGLGMVYTRAARLGLELHGRHRADPHGAGVSVRRLQVSSRADLDRRRFPAADDARHGVHRPGSALRSGRVLGLGIGASIASRVPVGWSRHR